MIHSKPFVRTLAAGAVGAALLLAPTLHAADGMATEEMAARIQQELASTPGVNGNFTVRIEDGNYVIAGLVDDIDAKADVRSALESIEGLDMSLLVNQVVVQ